MASTSTQYVNNAEGIGTPATVYYQYDGQGNRTRKVVEDQAPSRRRERRYMGEYETYWSTPYPGSAAEINHTSVHISDETGRFVLLEFDGSTVHTRYQHSDHLGSSHIETAGNGTVISYEEYHPFGTTAYQATLSSLGSAAKRYRYCGKERDEESGLYYYGARYYASWLGRFVSVDPKESKYFFQSSYAYAENSPVTKMDFNGEGSEEKKPKPAPAPAPPVMPKAPGDPTAAQADNTQVVKGKDPEVKKEEGLLNQISKTEKPKGSPELKAGKIPQPVNASKSKESVRETLKKLVNDLDIKQKGGAINYRSLGGPHEKLSSPVDFPKGELKEPPIITEGPISNGLLNQEPLTRIPKDFNPFGVMKAMYEFKKMLADLTEQLFNLGEEVSKVTNNNSETETKTDSVATELPQPKKEGFDTIFNPATGNTTIYKNGEPIQRKFGKSSFYEGKY